MRKVMYFFVVSVMALTLISCSTAKKHFSRNKTGMPATTNEESSVQTGGIGKEDNLIGSNYGPQDGVLGVRSFYFAFDRYAVKSEDVSIIKEHAQYLLDHPEAKIVIEGNADIRGSREYNIGLGQKRADAVLNILKMAGVSDRQVRTLSYGAERPVALGYTEEAYRLNRRSDIVYEEE